MSLVLISSWTWASDTLINLLPPHLTPNWVPIPGAPQTYYAPNLPPDVFRYQGKFYFYWEGYLYAPGSSQGPGKSVFGPPAFFYRIDPRYFKTLRPEMVRESQVLLKPPDSPPGPRIMAPDPQPLIPVPLLPPGPEKTPAGPAGK